ncbi:MAG: EAL domain-containing protein [Campylobacterota bacterium]|nr:EAL domain-containing protein [Campylobacterota bacterium]
MNAESCELLPSVGTHEDLIKKLRSTQEVSYSLINIDNFSNINNAYGYEVGNEILCNVVRYLKIVKPNSMFLYRYSTDKFVLLDDTSMSEEEIKRTAETILSFFSNTELIIGNIELKISLSIGISRGVGLCNISNAELAIKELREAKRNYYCLFNPNSDFVKRQEKNIYWILKIQEAVVNEDIVAYFQPIINNKTGKIEKYECLARIKDDDEIISPYLFLDAARVTGNLSYVTKSLITQSFKKFSGTDFEFSINIAGEDFLLDYLEFYLLKNAQKYDINPSRVFLEMLEDITTLGSGTITKQLDGLREKGFKVAIDDFGAENSNMSRLLEIQPDYLKIDGVFIKNIVDDVKSQIIVNAIVLMCKTSGIKIIAEYVHNEAVQEKMKELGIDYSQGFYFGKPAPNLTELSVSV